MFNLSFELKMTVQKQNYKSSVSVQQIEDQTVSRNLAGLLKGHITSKSNTGVCVRIASFYRIALTTHIKRSVLVL